MCSSTKCVLVGLAVLSALPATVLATPVPAVYYRFALPLPTVTCTTFGGQPAAVTDQTPIEWSGIPVGSSINVFELRDGAMTPEGLYPIAAGSGSQMFAGVTYVGSSFPLTAGFRYDTIANGADVYRSTLLLFCPAIGVAGTAQIINEDPTPVPLLSPWALATLAAGLALVALAVLRRRA